MSSSANPNKEHFVHSLLPRNDFWFPIEQVFDKVFNDLSDFSVDTYKKSLYPKWDIYETPDEYVVEVAATGCSPEDLTVEIIPTESLLHNKDSKAFSNLLKVSGRISQEYKNVDQAKTRFVCKELRRSVFERMTYLPNYVKGEPEATMSKGILKLVWKLPKEKKPETKKIEIKSFD